MIPVGELRERLRRDLDRTNWSTTGLDRRAGVEPGTAQKLLGRMPVSVSDRVALGEALGDRARFATRSERLAAELEQVKRRLRGRRMT
jgi:hypothetical protein